MSSLKLSKKIVAGSNSRKTRLHDQQGNLVSSSRLLMNMPRAIITGVMRVLFNYRVAKPWISYSAIAEIDKHLNGMSRVLEFGGGMSTLWYARRARQVVCVDDHAEWFTILQKITHDHINIDLNYFEGENDYVSVGKLKGGNYDLIVVDGSYRDMCVEHSLSLLSPGAALYLDNSDRDDPEITRATKLILDFATLRGGSVVRFTDFAPTQFFVQQGLLLKTSVG